MTDKPSARVSGTQSADTTKPPLSTYRFRRQQRLANASDFDRVFIKNYRTRDQHFVVLARHNHLTYARLGLAISRKAAGDAVPRNRLKRLVRESFRNRQNDFPGVDCVVMARPGAARLSGGALLKSLSKHWAKVSTEMARECEASS